jgi:hypothetical protein
MPTLEKIEIPAILRFKSGFNILGWVSGKEGNYEAIVCRERYVCKKGSGRYILGAQIGDKPESKERRRFVL